MPNAIGKDCLQSVELDARQVWSRVHDNPGHHLLSTSSQYTRFAVIQREPFFSRNQSHESCESFCATPKVEAARKREIISVPSVRGIEIGGQPGKAMVESERHEVRDGG
jgi:hypothetical protein